MLGIPHYKEKHKEKETFQKQSAMLEETVKLSLALVWHVTKPKSESLKLSIHTNDIL